MASTIFKNHQAEELIPKVNITNLGQVFTSQPIVAMMLGLMRNNNQSATPAKILEPACGNGAFLSELTAIHPKNADITAIEIDSDLISSMAEHIISKPNLRLINDDFFVFSSEHKFDIIIGNPPYVRYQDIPYATRQLLPKNDFDKRSNLYLFFIHKALQHLVSGGELIFITPRDFLKATSAARLNHLIYQQGTITDIIHLGDQPVFRGYSPNCVIFRFEKDNFSRKTQISIGGATTIKNFTYDDGQLLFTSQNYNIKFSDLFLVKVGAVSGADDIFASAEHANCEFVCSHTGKNGQTRPMLYNQYVPYLEQYKSRLLGRGVRKFDEHNWWQWGRGYYESERPRIYVNCKTRNKQPFFLHHVNAYDGSVLAIFPHDEQADLELLCARLNQVNWDELGFVCDGRFIFGQKSLSDCKLPENFFD